jgi:protocatechuate 3,4-dioxygenase beta subunit
MMKIKISTINKGIINAVLVLALMAGFTSGLQAKMISVGILPFHDESGTGMPGELRSKISRDLQQKLVRSYSDLLPRVIGAEMEAASFKTMPVAELAQYGKQQAVEFIVRGGLLSITTQNTGGGVRVSIDLYAEIFHTGSGQTKGVRARGVGTQRVTYPGTQVPWEALDISGSQFQFSAPGQALLNAVEQLAGQIHDIVTQPVQDTVETDVGQETTETAVTEPETSPDETTVETGEEYPTEEYPGEEWTDESSETASDEDLQQLIYQAEELVYNSALSEENLKKLTTALEKLKNSLTKKASLIEQGQDTTQVEQDIAAQKDALQQIITTLTEEASAYTEGGQEGEDVYDSESQTGEKKSLLAGIGNVLEDSLNIIQKIKEIKSTIKGADQEEQHESGITEETAVDETTEETGVTGTEETPAGEASVDEPVVEETTEEVSGVVTEEGEPVEGATVTDPETGISTTTDSSGFYNLGKIPAKRLSELVVSKGGKKLAAGKVNLVPGKAAVADWELKPRFSKGNKAALRVMPSTVNIAKGKKFKKLSGKTGTVKGVVLDAGGKPVPRALVKLKGLGTARTNSQGQYVFMKVPAGNHQVIVNKSGLGAKTQPVTVMAKKIASTNLRLAPLKVAPIKTVRPAMLMRNASTTLFGKVTDAKNQPLKGAKVMAIQSGNAVSVYTGQYGTYRMKGLKPGSYRVLASKTGFRSSTLNVTLKAKRAKKTDFKLGGASPYIRSILANKKAQKKPAVITRKPTKGTKGTKRPAIITKTPVVVKTAPKRGLPLVGNGSLTGRISDAATRRALSGAAIRVKGAGSSSNRSGSYSLKNLRPGTYTVNVTRSGYYAQSKSVRITSKRTARLDFALKPSATVKTAPKRVVTPKIKPRLTVIKGQIRGFVADSKTRRGIAGATVSISGQRSFSTNRSGSFVSPKLAPGRYRVSVSRSGYSSSVKTITVQAGRTSSATFYLTPQKVMKMR